MRQLGGSKPAGQKRNFLPAFATYTSFMHGRITKGFGRIDGRINGRINGRIKPMSPMAVPGQ